MHGETMLSLQDLQDRGLSSDSFLLPILLFRYGNFGPSLHRLPH